MEAVNTAPKAEPSRRAVYEAELALAKSASSISMSVAIVVLFPMAINPKPETNNDTPKISFRSNPNSQRNSAPTSQRLYYVDRVSGGGSGRSQPSAIKSPKVYSPQVLSSRSVKSISGRLTSSDRKAISARNEEIDMVKNLQ